jgi:DNA-binding transcriptional regulator LsrR (DeoR family)
MVRIEIGLPGGSLDAALSAELCSAFGLQHAFVYNFPDDEPAVLRHRLGEAAGQALMDLIRPGDVLGMSWSRVLSGLAASLTQIPPCPIVQLTGAVPPPDGRDLLDLVRSVARVGGGPAHVFYAPMLLDDAQTAAAIRRQGDIAEAFALVPSVTIAVVAIGAWASGLSTIYDAITPAERDAVAALGVCAELAGVFIGEDGRPVPTPLDSRMIVTPGPALERIPFVLCVAYDVAKSPAVCAAIQGGLVHGLVTHASLARSLLSVSPGGRPPGDPPHGGTTRPPIPPG